MGGFFKIDGPFYRFGNILFYLMVTNFLWFLFSIPIVTIGASTTALHYVIGKIVRDDDISVLSDFWKSFKLNFKQSTIVWLILLVGYLIVFTNIMNIGLLGNMARYILPLQIVILFELVLITLYIFPMLSRYYFSIKDLFKTCFFMGNRHIITTILCVASIAGVSMLFYKMPGLFLLVLFSLYALCSYYFIHRVMIKYVPEERKQEPVEEESFQLRD